MEGPELGLRCFCGCENFERVVVARTPYPYVTGFVACVECRNVLHAPLDHAVPPERPPGPPMPTGVVTSDPGMFKTYGGVLPGLPARHETPEQLQEIRDAAARASRSRRKR